MEVSTSTEVPNGSQPVEPAVEALSSSNNQTNGSAVTEDEAALYDRQIRLWGLEVQNRLRTSHILILGWNGIATEIIKNTVLSGIGSITILDPQPVNASIDLVSNFFFRDEDVGSPKCSQAPLDRVRTLNPLVNVNGLSDQATFDILMSGGNDAAAWLKSLGIDVMVVGTPLPESQVGAMGLKERLIALNDLARAVGIKFFTSATYGLGGFLFADQIKQDYLVERAIPNSTEKKKLKKRQTFIPLSSSLSYTWTGLTPRQQRRTRIPVDWFIWLALTDLTSRLGPDASSTSITPSALKDRTVALVRGKGLSPETIVPQEADQLFEQVVKLGGTGVTLAPVASVLGGILSQDILNSIGGREEPVVNWLFLAMDASGSANVYRIGEVGGAAVVD